MTSLTGTPAGCLIPNILLAGVPAFVPSFPAEIPPIGTAPAYINLPAPFSEVYADTSVNAADNTIVFDGPPTYTVDFRGMIPLNGYDCIITTTFDGVFNDLDPDDPDGVFSFEVLDVTGIGCTAIEAPDPALNCTLHAGVDGDPLAY